MKVTVCEENIAVIESDGVLIADGQDALDLMAAVRGEYGCGSMVVDRAALAPDFYDLSSGMAGEVLLKFTNYHFRMAVIGDFESDGSENLRSFVRESNRGSQFFFVATREEAIAGLRGGSNQGRMPGHTDISGRK